MEAAAAAAGPGSATQQPSPQQTYGRRRLPLDFDTFTEAFVRLAAALDVADELLERHSNPGLYRPWSEGDGKEARICWRRSSGDPLARIRRYRNRLVHGRVVPALEQGSDLWFPRVDRVNEHLDWRRVTTADAWVEVAADFERADKIVRRAWGDVVDYLESSWGAHLLARSAVDEIDSRQA